MAIKGKVKMKSVNIKINPEAHSRAKIISVLKGITLNDYLAKAIEQEIEKDKGILAKIK
jgi:predicted HicB family RNase H-like nuclease